MRLKVKSGPQNNDTVLICDMKTGEKGVIVSTCNSTKIGIKFIIFDEKVIDLDTGEYIFNRHCLDGQFTARPITLDYKEAESLPGIPATEMKEGEIGEVVWANGGSLRTTNLSVGQLVKFVGDSLWVLDTPQKNTPCLDFYRVRLLKPGDCLEVV